MSRSNPNEVIYGPRVLDDLDNSKMHNRMNEELLKIDCLEDIDDANIQIKTYPISKDKFFVNNTVKSRTNDKCEVSINFEYALEDGFWGYRQVFW